MKSLKDETQNNSKGKSNFEKAVRMLNERWFDSLVPMEDYEPSERTKDLFSKFENKDNNGSSD